RKPSPGRCFCCPVEAQRGRAQLTAPAALRAVPTDWWSTVGVEDSGPCLGQGAVEGAAGDRSAAFFVGHGHVDVADQLVVVAEGGLLLGESDQQCAPSLHGRWPV